MEGHTVNMAGFAILWVESTNCSSNKEPPVSSLGNILVVPEREHQLVACLSVLGECKPPLLRTLRKSEVWEGRGHNMEGRATRPHDERQNG